MVYYYTYFTITITMIKFDHHNICLRKRMSKAQLKIILLTKIFVYTITRYTSEVSYLNNLQYTKTGSILHWGVLYK